MVQVEPLSKVGYIRLTEHPLTARLYNTPLYILYIIDFGLPNYDKDSDEILDFGRPDNNNNTTPKNRSRLRRENQKYSLAPIETLNIENAYRNANRNGNRNAYRKHLQKPLGL